MFTELTKPAADVKMEKTCYGTISVVDGTRYVKLDGSDLLVPAASTVKTSHGDRVTVLMKNHSVTVTGNLTAPTTDGGTGTDGIAATIEVGTVTTGEAGSSASVTNSGTESKAVFDFIIPKGDKGDTGPQGPQGEKGDTGTWDGTIPDHEHTVSDITDFPTSLPANGGNADTVDGLHATDIMNMENVAKNRTSIANNTDLDTVKTAGKYVVDSASIASTVTNSAFVTAGYYLDVMYVSANNITQRAVIWSGLTKTRYYNGSKWSSWVSINDNGNADTLDGLHANEIASNPNLLINPDFKINQRGNTVYTTTGYTVDRWLMQVGFEITPLENGIRICPTRAVASNLFAIVQDIPVSKAMLGNDYTLTVNLSVTNDYAYAAVYAYNSENTVIRLTPKIKLNAGLNSTTITNIPDNTAYIRVQITINSGAQTSDALEILWTKLELGSVATPFVPPDPATELAKCQRYFYRMKSSTSQCPIFFIARVAPADRHFSNSQIRLPVPMRRAPTVTLSGTIEVHLETPDAQRLTYGSLTVFHVSSLNDIIDINIHTAEMASSEFVTQELLAGSYIDFDAEL